MNIVLGVKDSEASLNAFYWIKHNPLSLWDPKDLNLTLVHVLQENPGSGVSLLRRYESLAKEFAKIVSTRLLTCQGNVGKTLKNFTSSLKQTMLVIGCTQRNWKVIDYCVQWCECPVMVVKRDYSHHAPKQPILSLAMDVNVHCDRAFTWLLKQADLPNNSQLYVVHITPKKSDKPDARRFLAALKPKCLESKRLYSMASALVTYDRGTVPHGIIKFCHDKAVATLIIANKGEAPRWRGFFSSSITEECLRSSFLDILVWMDNQTRNVHDSPYIKAFQGVTPPPLSLAPWEDPSKVPQNPNVDDKDPLKNVKETKAQTRDDKPASPHPQQSAIEDKPLPIADNCTIPVKDSGSAGQRRKNSLKYKFYDQMAKGRNRLSIFSDETVEPLSP